MKIYKDQGYIIKLKTFQEADKLVVVVGKQRGTIEAIAKGASRSESRKGPSLDLLNLVKASFYETKGIDLLREIEVINDYQELKRNPKIINQLLYLLELLNRFNAVTNNELKAYLLLQDLLNSLTTEPEASDLLFSAFELKLLDLSGFTPNLENYLGSDKAIEPNEKRVVALGSELGYIYSNKASKRQLVPDQILKIQKYILRNNLRDVLRLSVDAELVFKIQEIQRLWIETITEKRLKSTQLLTGNDRH